LFYADRQTDMTKLIVTFHNFANTPKTLSVNAVQRNRKEYICYMSRMWNFKVKFCGTRSTHSASNC